MCPGPEPLPTEENMANNLTGNFDAVVEIGVRQINGLLATLHQNGSSDNNPLALLHSATFRIGHPRRQFPDVGDFGDWVMKYHRAHAEVPIDQLQDHLTATTPAGAAGRMQDVFSRFGQAIDVQP